MIPDTPQKKKTLVWRIPVDAETEKPADGSVYKVF